MRSRHDPPPSLHRSDHEAHHPLRRRPRGRWSRRVRTRPIPPPRPGRPPPLRRPPHRCASEALNASDLTLANRRAKPLGGRRRQRHADPRQPRHRHHPPRVGPVRGDLQPERDRLFLRRHHASTPTARRSASSPPAGHLSSNGVYVETKNQGGGLTDGPFHLLVACGPLGTRFAVVGYSANLVRATSGTSLTWLGSGRYRVRFASAVRGCAYLATVGDPGRRWCSARPACTPAAARTRTRSTSRPRIRAAASRTACRSTWP